MGCGKNIESRLAWGQGVAATGREARAAAQIDFDQDYADLTKELKKWARDYFCRGRCRHKVNGGIWEDQCVTSYRQFHRGGAVWTVCDIKQGLRAEVYCNYVSLKKTKGRIPGWDRKRKFPGGTKKKSNWEPVKKTKGTKKTKGNIPRG